MEIGKYFIIHKTSDTEIYFAGLQFQYLLIYNKQLSVAKCNYQAES